jgi:hypothetical protein
MSITEDPKTVNAGYRVVGEGLTVYDDPEPVEGTVVWLDSPEAVLDFVDNQDPGEHIVVSRGGTTTFLTPALVAGPKGVITLQGAPTSHLGIVSREFGIPCLMSVAFEEGVRTDRGEVIPPDGATVRIDISTSPRGRVLVREGMSLGEHVDATAQKEEQAAAAKAMADLQPVLERYRAEAPGTHEGDAYMRARQRTDILGLRRDSLTRDVTRTEINDVIDYAGWNLWDVLGTRATEGESGLIPRQEYEVLYVWLGWRRHPRFQRVVADAVGIDGLRDIAASARREISTKINPLHVWVWLTPNLTGRSVGIDLGIAKPDDKVEDIASMIKYTRALYSGLWGDEGQWLLSGRDYKALILEDEWIRRFRDERTVISDREHHALFQKFNAATGLLSFLMHMDSRCGVGDQGPYDVPDNQWLLVRDQVLNEQAYPWSDVCEGLPYSLTLAVFIENAEGMEKRVVDIGSLFTNPGNYLKYVKAYAVYARDTQDSPMSELRLLDEREMQDILERAEGAAQRLYPRIAAMSDRDKILAGIHVYHTDFIAPIARPAGVWDKMVNELGFYDIDEEINEVYDLIVTSGRAPELLLRHWITCRGFLPISDPDAAPIRQVGSSDGAGPSATETDHEEGSMQTDTSEKDFQVMHVLALRGLVPQETFDATVGPELAAERLGPLAEAGMVKERSGRVSGWLLTKEGRARHAELLERDKADGNLVEKLRPAYDEFLTVNQPFIDLCSAWQVRTDTGEMNDHSDPSYDEGIFSDLEDIHGVLGGVTDKLTEVGGRFAPYAPRFQEAYDRLMAGEHEWLAKPTIDSYHTVWFELHEDLLQSQGIARESESAG